MAECSESTGRTGALCSLAVCMTIFPAATSGSLLAMATALPERSAARVGSRPRKPTIADSTMSMLSLVDMASMMELMPANTFMPCGFRASYTSS